MIRRIIEIDREKCNGCGACASACHEGAIGMVDGKAVLLRDDYCDGLGDCLPACPTGAISFVEREAAAYDEKAVEENRKKQEASAPAVHTGCPSVLTGRRKLPASRKPGRAFPSWGSGPAKLSWCRCTPPIFREPSCSLPQTAPLLPMPISIGSL